MRAGESGTGNKAAPSRRRPYLVGCRDAEGRLRGRVGRLSVSYRPLPRTVVRPTQRHRPRRPEHDHPRSPVDHVQQRSRSTAHIARRRGRGTHDDSRCAARTFTRTGDVPPGTPRGTLGYRPEVPAARGTSGRIPVRVPDLRKTGHRNSEVRSTPTALLPRMHTSNERLDVLELRHQRPAPPLTLPGGMK
jgi:hypothetical protein